jgi:hypothetical protein
MSSPIPPPSRNGRIHLPSFLSSRRRRVGAIAVAVAVVVAIVLAVTDPFGPSSPSGAGVTDNEYPTSTTTVAEEGISSQTSVSATLGYAGSYTIAIPNGTSASTVSEAQSTVGSDETKVAEDGTALAKAESDARPTNASTLLAAQATVTLDQSSLAKAKAQLSSDEQLSCPASSSDTVTTALDGSSVPSSSGANNGANDNTGDNNSDNGSPGSSSPSGTTGNAPKAHVAVANSPGTTGSGAASPSAATGSVDQTTNTSTTLMGTVSPDGAATTYYFEYGTSPNYGETTASSDAGSGSSDLAVSTALSDLTPGATYHYRLVATNSYGTDYGQDATFTTDAPPTATTGSAATVTATSESLAGTVTPNGSDTSYYFEWGTNPAFENKTPITDVGAGDSASSASATITGLKPGATYNFALVATSALGTSTGSTATFQSAVSSCIAERAVITADSQALSEAKDALGLDKLDENSTVSSAEQTLSSDQAALTSAQQALSEDNSQAANSDTTFSALPSVGQVISRGQSVYSLNGQPVPLFYGTATMYRALFAGVSDGPDVAELQANLIALGFGSGISTSDHFSSATTADVEAWQRSLGVTATGVVALGDVVVEPGPIEVDTVPVSNGASASAGTSVLTATSTTREVTIDLDASEQSEVKVGDPVSVTLPDNSTTPGVVSSVGTVATAPASGAGSTGGGSTPTITVEVTLSDPKATGNLDQTPVEVAITNASVPNALVVPVDALLALSSGGYALEEIGSNGSHQLVPVSLGIFDDADGLVQVTGSGVAAGQKIVVPNT